MKKTLLAIAATAVLCTPAYAGGSTPKSLPRTVQGIDYAATLPAARGAATAIVPASDYPSDPGDLGVPDGNFTFDMIESWAGEGENRAALVIQFNDSREKNALVFGYRWDGQATGVDMIKAVAEANPRLYALLEYTNVSSPTDPNGGYVIGGLGWDADDDGDIRLSDGKNTYTTETGFVEHPGGYKPGQGGSPSYDYDNWKALDTDDFWGAGWYLSYWSYWVKEGDASSFGYSSWGASGRVLKDGSWDGWNFSLNMVASNWKTFVAAPPTIPEDAKTLFKHNGIYYSLKSYSSKKVVVCAPVEIEGETLSQYSGAINIPATFVDEDIEYTVVGIADAAFAGADITTVTVPETLTEIGADAFSATPLSALIFAGNGSADQLKKIGERAFCSTAITEAIFPKQISTIAAGVFCDTRITEVVIPEWVKEIGEMSFAANTLLSKVTILASVKTIGSGAFAECPALSSVKVETTVPPTITDDCFDADTYAAATLTVPVGYPATYAKAEGWKNFAKMAEYTMEVHVGDLFDMDGASFRITSVGDKNEVILTYKRVEGKADRTTITAANKAGYTGSITVAPTVKYQNIAFTVSAMNDSTFYGASELLGVVLPEGFTSIPDYAFYNCSKLAAVTIPSTVKSIGKYAFSNIDELESIVLPEGLTSLGERAFYYNSALKNINLPEGLTSLPNNLFCYSKALESIEIPESVATIGTYVFDNCSSLKSVKLPSQLTAIPNYTFNKCTSLGQISIPANVTSIGNYAFAGCRNLTEINIPASVSTIGASAFNDCKGLTEIRLPEAVKTINGSLFYGCSALTKVIMSPEAVLSGTQIFRNCSALETIAFIGEEDSATPGVFKVPTNTVTLQNYTITGCPKLTEIILPQSLKTIGGYALYQTAINSIDIPESVTAIQQYAFANTTIKEIVVPAAVSSLGNYLAQKNSDVTFFMCNPEPINITGTTFSSSGYNGPYLPVVVPTGTAETYSNKSSYWTKLEISAPAITEFKAVITGVEYDGDKHIVNGKITPAYDMTELPAKFEAANTAYVLANTEFVFTVSGVSRSASAGSFKAADDGTFSAEIDGLDSSASYNMAITANHPTGDFSAEPVSFDTPTSTGISKLEITDDTVADFYSVSGVRMANAISVAEARASLPAGIYMMRAEGKTCKIVIR